MFDRTANLSFMRFTEYRTECYSHGRNVTHGLQNQSVMTKIKSILVASSLLLYQDLEGGGLTLTLMMSFCTNLFLRLVLIATVK